MITQDNIQEINQVQFINSYYQDIEQYRDAFTDTPTWLIEALDKGFVGLINYNPGAMLDYGSYGVISTGERKKEFFRNDWIIKEGNNFVVKKGVYHPEKFINHVKKWKKIMREEGDQIKENTVVA